MTCENIYDTRLPIDGNVFSLYELADWKNGIAFKKDDFSPRGLPVIKIAELKYGVSGSTAWTECDFGEDVFLTKGDYVFSWSGNPETSIDIFRYNLQNGWLNQHIFKVIPKTKLVRKEFFFFLMKWLKHVFKQIADNKQTTGLGHITISDLKKIQVTIPPFEVQERIEHVLCPLDFKIMLNNHLLTGEVHVFVRFCGIVCDVDAVSLCASWLYFCFNLRDTLNMTHDSKQRRLT